MEDKKDIAHLDDIKILVDTFYGKIRADDFIGPIFNNIIGDRWSIHLEKMYSFWQTILLEEHTYMGRPFPPHAQLPVDERHFARWLHLFFSTVDDLFAGEKAERAKWQGERMAEMFHHKIQYFRNNNAFPLA